MNKELEKRNYDKLLEVADALMKSKWIVKSIDFEKHLIIVSRFFAEVEIYCDVCEQRISLNEKYHPDCHYYCEVEEENEIVTTIIKLINEFRHENYRLTYINRYGQHDGHDRIEDFYFPDEKSLLEGLLEEEANGENIYSLEEREHQYPNPAIKLIVKKVKYAKEITDKYWQFKDSLVFECHRVEYKVVGEGYVEKVLNEIKEDKVYYAFVSIKD